MTVVCSWSDDTQYLVHFECDTTLSVFEVLFSSLCRLGTLTAAVYCVTAKMVNGSRYYRALESVNI